MRLDFATFAFGYRIKVGGGTPNWATALGQSTKNNYRINDTPDIKEILKGMIYSAVDLAKISTKIGKGGATVSGTDPNNPFVLASLFSNVYVNDTLVTGGKFVLLITRDDSASHTGRLRLKYGPHNTFSDTLGRSYSNNDFFAKVRSQFGLSDSACWFVSDISIRNQNELRMRTIFVDKHNTVEYDDTQALHRAWEELAPEIPEVIERRIGKNILLYGVPGSGKSWTVKHEYCPNEDFMERVVFHPDYTYADFVGQIMPVTSKSGDKVTYRFVPGPFTRILKQAIADSENDYFLVIEEINRGNAPAIFGDIFQLLDRSQGKIGEPPRGNSVYGITNTDIARYVLIKDITNASDEDVEFAEKQLIHLPSNLSIIATMNTSDQNVFTLDTAFQRRWHMRLIDNDINNARHKKILETPICDTQISWKKFLKEINAYIISDSIISSSEDKRFGIYFVTQDELTDPQKWAEKILKYLWDDAFKFDHEKVFDTTINKSLDMVIKAFTSAKEEDRFSVLAANVREKILSSDSETPAEG